MALGHRSAALVALGAALAASGCGSSGSSSSSQSSTGATKPPTKAQRGGALTVLNAADVDYIDPGATYYQYGFVVAYATQRPLYSFKPDDPTHAAPDLAAGPAKVSSDGKTVTVKIRKGVKFSPPVNREVTSADVKYAIERGFNPAVANGYAAAYFGDLLGAPKKPKGPVTIPGIETPDKYTVVFKLKRARGRVVAGALALPLSAPVPKSYALKYDEKNPSQYGTHQIATGPYMIKNDASGKAIGYKPSQFIDLVRNPNWNKATDYKPAYLDSITFKEGNDPTVASKSIETNPNEVSGDFQLPAEVLARGKQLGSQFIVSPPTGRVRYVAFNTHKPPFNNINLRKAVVAAFDRTAMRQAFGGPLVGLIPTHFIPPPIAGFKQAGGMAGPGYDFLKSPSGDMTVAKKYMKAAGFPSGKYHGPPIQMVADQATVQQKAAQVAQNQFAKLGFNVHFKAVTRDVMYTNFCDVPKKEPEVCPSVGWLKDFPDPETMLDLTFNGKNIIPVNNSNWPLLNNSKVNQAMAKAELLQNPAQRAQAWGQIDRQITGLAPAIPWLWDKQPVLQSKNVNGVINGANATWDLNFTSLKK